MRKEFMIYAQDPITETRNEGFHWYAIPGLDGNKDTVSFAYTRKTGETCYMKMLQMGNVDCATLTEGYGDYDRKKTQYSWLIHDSLEKEFFGKSYNDPRG
jgi:hypothetical protein